MTDKQIVQLAMDYSIDKSRHPSWALGFFDGYKRAQEEQIEMLEALKATNEYFVALQNKCALTASDERAWKLVSKILNKE